MASPMRSDPINPGPRVTAIPSNSRSPTPASDKACSIVGLIASICLREAISGTTPPYLLCAVICEAITLESIFPSLTTAAAVSSHDDSIPRTIITTCFHFLFAKIEISLYKSIEDL